MITVVGLSHKSAPIDVRERLAIPKDQLAETLTRLEGENRVVFRYADNTNPNGAMNDIAGIINEQGTVIGMMPHPENMIEPLHGRADCRPLFESLLAA